MYVATWLDHVNNASVNNLMQSTMFLMFLASLFHSTHCRYVYWSVLKGNGTPFLLTIKLWHSQESMPFIYKEAYTVHKLYPVL